MSRLSSLLLLLLTACAPSKLAANFIVNPIRVPVVGAPAEPHEPLVVTTADGLKLHGWVFRAREPRGLVVLLHGKDINRQHYLAQALRLRALGFVVVAYDQRAHGQSEGTSITYGVHEVGDLQRVLDAVPVGPVYVVGESLGAAVALQAAAVEPRIRGVVAAASFADLRTLLQEKTPFFFDTKTREDTLASAEATAGFDLDAVSPEKAAARITAPVMLVHGIDDTFIPMRHSLRIYDALRAPKELVRLEGVSHMDVLLHEQAWKEIERFLLAPLPQ